MGLQCNRIQTQPYNTSTQHLGSNRIFLSDMTAAARCFPTSLLDWIGAIDAPTIRLDPSNRGMHQCRHLLLARARPAQGGDCCKSARFCPTVLNR